MAYRMRYRVRLLLMNPQNTPANDPPIAGETELFNVGSYEVGNGDPLTGTGITSVVITSLSRAVAAIQSINNRIQSALLTNVRFEVYGKPVGSVETGAIDIPANLQEERKYITGDTPQPALLIAMRRANRKPYDPNASTEAVFIPEDDEPEVNQDGAGD